MAIYDTKRISGQPRMINLVKESLIYKMDSGARILENEILIQIYASVAFSQGAEQILLVNVSAPLMKEIIKIPFLQSSGELVSR